MWERFEIGFWHPFGPYAGLSPAQVLEWKAEETARYGWARLPAIPMSTVVIASPLIFGTPSLAGRPCPSRTL